MDMLHMDIYVKVLAHKAKQGGFVPQKNRVIETSDRNSKNGMKEKSNLAADNSSDKVSNGSVFSKNLLKTTNTKMSAAGISRRFVRDVRDKDSNYDTHHRHSSEREPRNKQKFSVKGNNATESNHNNRVSSEDNLDWLKEIEDIETDSPSLIHSTTPLYYGDNQRKSALVGRESQQLLQSQFVTQNAVLLSVACLGALLLIAANLVGVLCCKGYFRRRVKTIPPSSSYPRPRSWFTWRPHTLSTRQFSLDSQAASIVDELRERHIREDPIFGQCKQKQQQQQYSNSRSLSVPCTSMYGIKKPQNPSIQLTDNSIEMAELNAFDVKIEEWEPGSNEAVGKGDAWKELLRKFRLKRKTFKEKTEQANATGYFS